MSAAETASNRDSGIMPRRKTTTEILDVVQNDGFDWGGWAIAEERVFAVFYKGFPDMDRRFEQAECVFGGITHIIQ